MKSVLYIEGCNFVDFPLGGTLSFSKQFIQNIELPLYLVGLGEENDPIGKWIIKKINGIEYHFYAIGKTSDVQKSVIPKRLITFIMLRRHISKIHEHCFEKCDILFSQTPQFVFLLSKYKWKKFCFCFAGLGNSVGNSRFKTLRIFGSLYEKKLFHSLKVSCDIILAAADRNAIAEKTKRYNLNEGQIKMFPTRFDDKIYYLHNAKMETPIVENDTKLIITTGRLARIKGWRDLIDSFRILQKSIPNSKLIFIGDGEDKLAIETYADEEIRSNTIELVGYKKAHEIARYLNAADLFVLFSHLEGWPTSIVEAIACGKNVVTTDVSGSSDMVKNDLNGYIVTNRDITTYAIAMEKALKMKNPNPLSIEISKQYSSTTLNEDFNKLVFE